LEIDHHNRLHRELNTILEQIEEYIMEEKQDYFEEDTTPDTRGEFAKWCKDCTHREECLATAPCKQCIHYD